jgi:hypothetical protein
VESDFLLFDDVKSGLQSGQGSSSAEHLFYLSLIDLLFIFLESQNHKMTDLKGKTEVQQMK